MKLCSRISHKNIQRDIITEINIVGIVFASFSTFVQYVNAVDHQNGLFDYYEKAHIDVPCSLMLSVWVVQSTTLACTSHS